MWLEAQVGPWLRAKLTGLHRRGSQRGHSALSIQGRTTVTQHLPGNNTMLNRTSRASGPACMCMCTDMYTRERHLELESVWPPGHSAATGECCGGHLLHPGSRLWGGAGQKLEPVGSKRDRWALRVMAVQRRGRIPDMFGYVGGFSVKCELEGNNLRILRE